MSLQRGRSSRRNNTLAIISAVHKRKPMWVTDHPMKKNAKFMWNLWHEIADEVGDDVEYIRARWKHLRSYYAHTYKDHVNSGRSPAWQYYTALSFLSDVIEKSWKDEEEKQAMEKELEFHANTMDLEGFPEVKDELMMELSKSEDDSNDHLISIVSHVAGESNELIPKHEPIEIPSDSSSASTEKLTAEELSDPPDSQRPRKTRKTMRALREESTEPGTSTCGTTYVTEKRGSKRKTLLDEGEPTSSSSGWLAIERRKQELLKREVAEEANPDMSFFKSLLPILKFLSEPQKLKIRMAINQIILKEYNLVKGKALANCFQLPQ